MRARPETEEAPHLVHRLGMLCVAGLAATEALTDSSPADADCADSIAEAEAHLADLGSEGASSGTAVAWISSSSGTDDCLDELREHFDGG